MDSEKKWSDQQVAIFEWFASGRGNLVVRARAGTGKTTTIIAGIDRAPEKSILLAAFNKRIAEELVCKLKNQHAEAKTLHSLGFSFVRRAWGSVRVDSDRGFELAKKVLGAHTPKSVLNSVKKLAGLGKNCAPFGPKEDVLDLAYQFAITPSDEDAEYGWTVEKFADAAWKVMDLAKQPDGTVDFDDMLFIPVACGFVRPHYDLVVIDEAQDMNACQLLLAQGCCRKRGRVAVVGDDRQAIYGFRGADSNSIDRLKEELRATELGLTATYRCPKKVVAVAQGLVPDYQAAATAPEGEVLAMDALKMLEAAQPGDAVLSRKNAPLATVCLKLLKMGKRARIEGRDIGKSLVSIVKGRRAKSIQDLVEKLKAWQERQLIKGQAIERDAARDAFVSNVRDQYDMLVSLMDGAATVEELVGRLESLFVDNGGPNAIVCSSVHKAKGLEWDRVFVLSETFYPGGRRGLEEQNIEYVAVTRAKRTLVNVTGLDALKRPAGQNGEDPGVE